MKKHFHSALIAALLCLTIALSCVIFAACNDKEDKEKEKIEYYSLELDIDETLSEVSLSPAPNADGKYIKDTIVTLSVVPNKNVIIKTCLINDTRFTFGENGTYMFVIKTNTKISVELEKLPPNTVTLEFDENKGTVEKSAPANGEEYAVGERVTVTVSPKARNFLKSFTVGDVKQTLDENSSYSFDFAESVVVKAVFQGDPIPSRIFELLQQNISFDGSYVYDADDNSEDKQRIIKATFAKDENGENLIRNFEQDAYTREVYFDDVYVKSPVAPLYLARQYLNQHNVLSYQTTNMRFSEFANPFTYTVDEDDFEYVKTADGTETYSLMDPALRKKAASAITGWSESIGKFEISFKDGVPTNVLIVTMPISITGYDNEVLFTYVSTYNLTVTDLGTAHIESLKPFERVPEHDMLEAALAEAKSHTQYTVHHFAHEFGYDPNDGADHSDLDYNKYVTEDCIYIDHLNYEFGYKLLNGYLYPFTYDKSSRHVTTDDAIQADFQELCAPFEFNGATELFKYVGDNTFTLQGGEYIAYCFSSAFALGIDEQKYFDFAGDVRIVIDSGERLESVTLKLAAPGINEEVTLTFDFDSPVDLSFLDFETADHHSILDGFLGMYEDENGNTAVVDIYGFIINGKAAEVVSFDRDTSTFTAKWDGKTVYINKYSSRQLQVISEDYSVFLLLTAVNNEAVTIPEEYKGHWQINDLDYDVHLDIVLQSHAVFLDGEAVDLLSYTDREGITVINAENATYNFSLAKDQDTGSIFMLVLILNEDGTAFQYIADYVNSDVGIEIPEKYVGTYLYDDVLGGNSIMVVITYTSITINGKPFEIQSYTSRDGFTGTYDGIGGYKLMLAYNNDTLTVGTMSDNYNAKRINLIDSHYVGTWKPLSDDYKGKYTLSITETAITIVYNDGTKTNSFTVNSDEVVNSEYGYELNPEWAPSTMYLKYSFISGSQQLVLYDNIGLLVNFEKSAASEVQIPEKLFGTYYGTVIGGSDFISLDIDNNEVYLMLPNEQEKQVTLIAFDETCDMITLECDGIEYYLIPSYEEDHEGQYYFSNQDGTVCAYLTKLEQPKP